MRLPLVAVGFMYPQGYLRQMISPDGWQVGACEIMDRESAPIRKMVDANGDPITIKVPVMDPPIYLEVWKVHVGKTSLYLIDTSSEANDPWNRVISDRLYTGDLEQRLRQEIVLGIGGVCILRHFGVDYSVLHCNEGHPLSPSWRELEEGRRRARLRGCLRAGPKHHRLTTHTPVPAGHDVFPTN